MVIFVPTGSSEDETRLHHFYDETYNYLRAIGIVELCATNDPSRPITAEAEFRW
jgi:hypothetical protein